VPVLALLLVMTLATVGFLGVHILLLSRRVKQLERARDIERRHRELLTVRLGMGRGQGRAPGIPPDPDAPTVGVALRHGAKPDWKH
jgi:hypothetical protein